MRHLLRLSKLWSVVVVSGRMSKDCMDFSHKFLHLSYYPRPRRCLEAPLLTTPPQPLTNLAFIPYHFNPLPFFAHPYSTLPCFALIIQKFTTPSELAGRKKEHPHDYGDGCHWIRDFKLPTIFETHPFRLFTAFI